MELEVSYGRSEERIVFQYKGRLGLRLTSNKKNDPKRARKSFTLMFCDLNRNSLAIDGMSTSSPCHVVSERS
jgi:hypothetical protein